MSRIEKWVRPNILDLKPYSSARTEHESAGAVLLDANENPYEKDFNRYPDPLQKELKSIIGDLKDFNPEQMLLGNGSDEPIDLLMRVFCTPGKSNIIVTDPSYGMYQVSAAINNVEVRKAKLNKDFSLNLDHIRELQNENSRILFLCTPNNPTGNDLDKDKIMDLVKSFEGIVVVDEAYIDFSEEDSVIHNIKDHDNLVVLQTLSKAWGMAGLRLGICFAQKEIVDILNKVKPPYNIPGPSQYIAIRSLMENRDAFSREVEEIKLEKKRLSTALKKHKRVIYIYPSSANFLLVKFEKAKEIYHYMVENKMMIRDRTHETHCDGCLRITIGTPAENDLFLNLLEKFN